MVYTYPQPLCYVASFDINVTAGTSTLTSERVSTGPVTIWSELSLIPIPLYDDDMIPARTQTGVVLIASYCN